MIIWWWHTTVSRGQALHPPGLHILQHLSLCRYWVSGSHWSWRVVTTCKIRSRYCKWDWEWGLSRQLVHFLQTRLWGGGVAESPKSSTICYVWLSVTTGASTSLFYAVLLLMSLFCASRVRVKQFQHILKSNDCCKENESESKFLKRCALQGITLK